MFCGKCGKMIEENTSFCRYCGAKQIYNNPHKSDNQIYKNNSPNNLKIITEKNERYLKIPTIVGTLASFATPFYNLYSYNWEKITPFPFWKLIRGSLGDNLGYDRYIVWIYFIIWIYGLNYIINIIKNYKSNNPFLFWRNSKMANLLLLIDNISMVASFKISDLLSNPSRYYILRMNNSIFFIIAVNITFYLISDKYYKISKHNYLSILLIC